jgi:hypothetical protein
MVKTRKGQNEIVGFVMIVVIVTIIGLFLLALYLRQEPVKTESKNVQNFLKASLSYTTECKIDIEPLDLKELTKRCHNGAYCGENESCVILNDTFSDILEKTWKLESNKESYYNLNVYYREGEEEESRNEEILNIEKGNCTGSKVGAEEFFRHGQGDIFVTLEICYI